MLWTRHADGRALAGHFRITPADRLRGIPGVVALAIAALQDRTGALSSCSGMRRIITDAADLGVAVRAARKRLGVSQETLAAAAGVGQRFVVEREAGKPTVQLDRVLAVLAALDVTLEARQASPGETSPTPV